MVDLGPESAPNRYRYKPGFKVAMSPRKAHSQLIYKQKHDAKAFVLRSVSVSPAAGSRDLQPTGRPVARGLITA